MSDGERGERRSHFRSQARPNRRIDVEYRLASGGAAVKAQTRNIGVGGAFILTPAPARPGEQLVLSLRVPPANQLLDVRGEVRWTSSDPNATGMGVKFIGLDVEQLLQLNEYFASLTGRDEE